MFSYTLIPAVELPNIFRLAELSIFIIYWIYKYYIQFIQKQNVREKRLLTKKIFWTEKDTIEQWFTKRKSANIF